MGNMTVRYACEGGSMFAKLVDRTFLNIPPVVARQDRIVYLTGHLLAEARRAVVRNTPCRIFNIGCGPAKEIQDFLAGHELSDQAHFTLLDFNEETIAHTSKVLGERKARHGRLTSLQ